MNAPKRGRPRKWKSDAERMRAHRRRQRAKELRGEVLNEDAEAAEQLVDAQPIAALPNAETVTDLKQLVNLLMIACRVEGGVEEWLHQTCDDRLDWALADLGEESDAHEHTLNELGQHEKTVRAMTVRLVEVDPDGPLVPKTLAQHRADVLAKWAKQ